MIRPFETNDLSRVIELWLETNKQAHDFIENTYWEGKYAEVKKMMPAAELYVYEENNAILGFVGLMDTYLAGIFIDTTYQSRGIGKQLVDAAKDSKERLLLQVYTKNKRAVSFYSREGFSIIEEKVDEATEEAEYVMEWKR